MHLDLPSFVHFKHAITVDCHEAMLLEEELQLQHLDGETPYL